MPDYKNQLVTTNKRGDTKAELTLFKTQLGHFADEYRQTLPATISEEKMRRSVITAVGRNPKLLDADRLSLLGAAMSAAQLGLEVSTALQHAHLVPFKGKVQMIPGYPGYVMLASNSWILLKARVVREVDEFDYSEGTEPFLHHKPPINPETDRGGITHAYAISSSRMFPSVFWVMDYHEICQVRDKSAGYRNAVMNKRTDSLWHTDFPAMARKTPLRLIAKQMPLRLVQMAAAFDDAADMGRFGYIDKGGQMATYGANEQTPDLLS